MKVCRVGCAHQKKELAVRHILAILVVALLFGQSAAFAETKEIIAEGTYNMGDGETPTVAESRALLQAKRTAVEEAGTYVESYSKTKNFQLTVDEIQVLASGVMEVEVLEKKRTVVGDGFNFWIKIKARVSTDKMEEMAKRVKEKSVVEDYKKIQEAYDKSQKEIEELKRQLAGAKGEKQKKQVEGKIADDERLFRANEMYNKGYDYGMNNEHDKAIEAFTFAITLNPTFVKAYVERGLVYGLRGQIKKGLEDFNLAINIDSTNADIYHGRGLIHYINGQSDMAIKDYSKAITLNSKKASAFNGRAGVYSSMGNYLMAFKDYNKAIEIDPGDAYIYYYNRGRTYEEIGDIERAKLDYRKACELGFDEGCNALQRDSKKR